MDVLHDDLFKNKYFLGAIAVIGTIIAVVWFTSFNSIENKCRRRYQTYGNLLGVSSSKLSQLQLKTAAEPLIQECILSAKNKTVQTTPTTAPSKLFISQTPTNLPNREPTIEAAKESWRTYSHFVAGYKIKYPDNFRLDDMANTVEIYSLPTVSCTSGAGIGNAEKVNVNELKMVINYIQSKSYSEAWKNAFEFDFDGKGDGNSLIAGKKAYYFYQGAEMLYSRQAFLLETIPGSYLEINIYQPQLVYNCRFNTHFALVKVIV
ncbi:MAG: hypothetical protein G01um101416_1015 [Microgenomates group bacterium Gr01-1014_16]|nr:MAG: hypothetical protein G01um101416_1015 [Microgenomates group bacterium Gr01-1014_16]